MCLGIRFTKGSFWILEKDLDAIVREFVKSLRKIGEMVNTSIVMAAAEGMVATKSPFLLVVHGGHT